MDLSRRDLFGQLFRRDNLRLAMRALLGRGEQLVPGDPEEAGLDLGRAIRDRRTDPLEDAADPAPAAAADTPTHPE